ncbi:class F sortase [Lapillicoccus jejuensis]|uniref:Sortase family protein n=1 Tax=Lapillicoccus jejuensis TaxID=402171 RepID=A0A542E256_9MICO|nr:class F sortase [Lapillicoccus jejuensis]TQJ09432.1 sortase family protein [Lapillicoccus jejuensis]
MAGRISRGRVVGALSAALLAGGATAYATVGDVGANAVPAPPSPTSSAAPAVPSPTGPTGAAGTTGAASAAAPRPTVTARDARITAAAAVAAPVRLQVGQIGLDLPVVPEAVAGDGQMALPPTPFEAGWYRYGPAPGDPDGAAVVAAHVDTRDAGVGPMAGLGSVRPGASVVVTSADGTRHTYRVESVRSVAKTSLDLRALFTRTGPPRLHLVTCGGEYDRVARHYENNVVVVAVPTGP